MADAKSRSPQGERGLKPNAEHMKIRVRRRSPQGERGLKLVLEFHARRYVVVAPRKGSVG